MSMSQSDLEVKTETLKELNKMFRLDPLFLEKRVPIIDDLTRAWIKKSPLKILENPHFGGQSYVCCFCVKEDGTYFCANPSGWKVYKQEERKGEKFLEKRRELAELFGCLPEEVLFPNDAVLSGVVHTDLKENIAKRNKSLVENSKIASLSVTIVNGIYLWANKSALNFEIFVPDDLAIAYFMFYKKSEYLGAEPPKFDLWYHVTRAVPKEFFEHTAEAVTKELAGDEKLADFTLCPSFKIQDEWIDLCKLFISDRAVAQKKIHDKLMSHLFVYASKIHVQDFRNLSLLYLKNGISSLKKYGIKLDLNYVPDEFKGEKPILEMLYDEIEKDVPRKDDEDLYEFLINYRDGPIISALEEKNYKEAAELLKNLGSINPKAHVRITNEIKELLTEILSEEKPNFKKTNDKGDTLLLMTTKLKHYSDQYMLRILLDNGAEVNVLDRKGQSPLFYAYDSSNDDGIKYLLERGADPALKGEGGKSPLEAAIERYRLKGDAKFFKLFLKHCKVWPDLEISDEITAIIIDENKNFSDVDNSAFDILLSMIATSEKKSDIQNKLHKIVINVFANSLESNDVRTVMFILNLNSDILPSLDGLDLRKIEKLIIQFMDKNSDLSLLNNFIGVLSNKSSALGKKLFESEDFQADITKKGKEISIGIKIEEFINLARFGNFEEAKSRIQNIPKEMLLPAIKNPFYKHLADILLDENPDFNKKTADGKTVLYFIPEIYGDQDVADALLERKADPRILNEIFINALENKNINELKAVLSSMRTATEVSTEYYHRVSDTKYFRDFLYNIVSADEIDFNKKDKGDNTLLHLAAHIHDPKIINALLNYNIDPNSVSEYKNTALSDAIRLSNKAAIKMLIKAKSDLHFNNISTPFEDLLQKARYHQEDAIFVVQIFNEYINQFPDFYAAEPERFDNMILKPLETLLRDDINFLDKVLNKINIQSNLKIKAHLNSLVLRLLEFNLERADSFSILKILRLTHHQYQLGEEVDLSKLINKMTAFIKTQPEDKTQIIDAILSDESVIGTAMLKSKEGSKFKEILGQIKIENDLSNIINQFVSCVQQGDLDEAKKCLHKMPKDPLPDFKSPLLNHFAHQMLDEKFNVNGKNSQGNTVLHLALNDKNYSLLAEKLILKLNANPNILDASDTGPLFYAIKTENWDMVRLLISKNAIFQPDKKYDFNPIELLVDRNMSLELIPYFITRGVKFSDEYVRENIDNIKDSFKTIISNCSADDLPNLFESISHMLKTHTTPDVQQSLHEMIFILFEEYIELPEYPDVLNQFLKLKDLPVLADVKFNQKHFQYLLRESLTDSSFLKDDIKLKLIDSILDPTSSIGRRVLKSESTSATFATGSAADADKFKNELIQRRDEVRGNLRKSQVPHL